MTLNEFVDKYNSQYIEVAGTPDAKNQCTDLVNAYLREVLNHPIVEWTNAADFPAKLTDFDWIPNTPDGVPQEGDIVVWQNNTVGHIAVFIEGTTGSFRSFDQNWPTGSPCHVQNHIYIDQMLWGRPKAKPIDTNSIILSQSDAFIAICTKLNKPANKDIVLAEIEKLLTLEESLKQTSENLTKAQEHAGQLEEAFTVQEGVIVDLQKNLKELNQKVEDALLDNKTLSSEVQELKTVCSNPTFVGWKSLIYQILLKL